jgi:hypothetical protein
MKQMILAALLLALGLSTPALARGLVVPQPEDFPLALSLQDKPNAPDGLLWLAQSCEGDCGEDYGNGGKKAKGVRGSALNSGVTKTLVKILGDANRTCDKRIELRYRIDCLRIYYGWVADELPDVGDYVPIKKAMRRAEAKLNAIVKANLDTTEPKIEPREGHKKNAARLPPIRPVKKAAAKKAAAQATAGVEELELVILRSGEDPSKRKPHFTEVAAAVEDNLVVLRSA